MGNTHHKKKVAHCAKRRPVWYFGLGRPDKQKQAASKSDDEAKWAVHYKTSQYQHQQENVFLPSARPPHIEDLHKEAEIGLRSLQEQGTLNACSELQLGNGQESMDNCSQISQDEDVPVLPDSAPGGPGDEVWTKTRSLPPPTPDEIRKSVLGIQPSVSSTGTTFKPQGHQKMQSSFKGPKLKEKRIRRTTIMGLPQHVQHELGLGKGSRSSKTVGAEPLTDSAGMILVSREDENRCFNNLSHSRARSSLRSVTFSDPSREDNESISTLGLNYQHNWALINSSNRPKSLAVPKSSVPSELLQSPVMSMSPQATYLSKIIPNAILPPTVDVVMISASQNCLRQLSNSGVLCTPSPTCSRSISLQNYDGRDYASSDAWSNSQSSETIVSNNSTISSQGNTGIPLNNNAFEKDGESVRVDHNLTDSPPDHRASTSRWVSECSAQSASPVVEDPSAQLNPKCKPAELSSNGYPDQSLSPAQSTSSIADASDTQSITSERSVTRSLSVRKMKKAPAPPRRMHSLQPGEEQDSETKGKGPASFEVDGQTSGSRFEFCSEPPAGESPPNPALSHKLLPTHDRTSNGNIHSPRDPNSPNRSEHTTSPSSGSPATVKALVPPPSPTGRSKAGAPRTSSSLPAPETSNSASRHANLFVIPPPPSTPAPPPPNVKRPTFPTAVSYPWGPEAIPPPPAGPAPLPPTKRPSFLFNIPARGPSHPCPPQVSASAPTVAPLVTESAPTTTPLVTESAPTVTPLVTESAPTATPLVTTSAPTLTQLATTSTPTTTSLVTTSAPTVTPLVTTSVPTLTQLVTTSTTTTTPLVTESAPTVAPLVTTSTTTTTPLVTESAPTVTPLATTSTPTITPLDTTSRAPIVTGSLTPVLLASASAPGASQTTSTSTATSASCTTTRQLQQGVTALKVKQPLPPPSPPPSHHPPPPPKKSGPEQLFPASSLSVSEAPKQEQPPVDWPPPPPPLSPSSFVPDEMLLAPEGAGAEFLFPPPPPSLLEDAAEGKRPSDEENQADVQLVPAPAPSPPSASMPGQSVGLSPPPQPAETSTSSPQPLTPSPAISSMKQLQPKTQPAEGTDSHFPNNPLPPIASNQDSAKVRIVQPPPHPEGDGEAGAPIVTPSLLQMVRLRSVQMNASAPGMPDSKQQTNRSQTDLKQPTKSNVTAPSKPVRKSLSQRLSSSSDSEPAVSADTSLPVKNTPLSTVASAAQGHTLSKPGDDETPHKSPASTASFIFSKNVSPKKLVFETPRSPEAEAEAKKNFMAELSSVSGRIASKTESKSLSRPQSKAAPEVQRKAGRVPPPVAKKPSFLPGSQRLTSMSTSARELPNAQETSQALQVTSDAQEEKGKVKTGNGQVSLCKGD
ncbi:uncharacterized protein KIAA1522-like isoform X2 [Pristis pectinata]|uniref:uncharacterized protein KIAA1522-like isoform X2 n=1 Tax=Pristis pectinata TaxID=685728 RepID=UPI00223C98A7|nr:uncharacterized protein KIAA1522-like isoform X2 [Pristis pectinata]